VAFRGKCPDWSSRLLEYSLASFGLRRMNPGGTAKSARDRRPESCAESSAYRTKGGLRLLEETFHSTKSASVQVQQSLQVLSCES
jgi:hypothetical protein